MGVELRRYFQTKEGTMVQVIHDTEENEIVINLVHLGGFAISYNEKDEFLKFLKDEMG